MKKIILVLAVATLFMVGCTSGTSKKEPVGQQKTEAAEADSITQKIDQTKKDIEESTEELDELVKNL
ncbi:MAG: hypothetical protein V2I54_13300 [Bacteroidales bacterium]|jgi:peptidoglycan hydrolase CwlO-like protein|nr:hypothetical protein [Bacteroidales bacterium]